MTIEQITQRILDQRGYLVVGTSTPRAIGHVSPRTLADDPSMNLEHKTVVIGETNREDAEEQAKFMPAHLRTVHDYEYWYKVTAE